MFSQFVFLNNLAVGNAVASATLQAPGTLVAVQFAVFPTMILGAGDELCAEIELSLNNVIAQASQMSPPNGVIAKDILSAAVDIAGTSIAYLNPAQSLAQVAPRKMVAGQIVYVNINTLTTRAGGAANYFGYVILHLN